MRVLVIGASSSVGKVLIGALRKKCQVLTAGRAQADLILDLKKDQPIVFSDGIDAVVHMAAHFGGTTADEIREAEAVNVLGTLRLAAASKHAGVKHFVYISSIYSLLPSTSPQYSIYALSKKQAEESISFLSEKCNLPLTILRPGPLYGDTADFKRHQPFFYAMAEKAELGEDIILFGKNDAKRNFLHVNDLVEIIERVIDLKITGSYSCQFPSDTTIHQIGLAALNAFQSKGGIYFRESEPDIRDNVFPPDHTLYSKINFYPQIDVQTGMKRIAKARTQ